MRAFEDSAGDRIEVGIFDTAGREPRFFHIVTWGRGADVPAIAELDPAMAHALAADLLAFADEQEGGKT